MKCKNSHGQLCAIFAIVILLNVPASLFATTYTAVLSGDWTSALTWGGTAPPTTISGEDQIIIAANVTVNMDTHVEINNALASIAVIGNLESQNNLTVTSGSVIGTGNLIVNELMVAAEGTIVMTGQITCETLETASNLLTLSASTSVNAHLMLNSGVCQIDNSGSLELDSEATIEIADGQLQNLGGSLTAQGSFNLLYSGNSTTTGDETSAGTIANLTINLSDNNQMVNMDSDLQISGELSLLAGQLSLNGSNLTLEGTCQAMGGAAINGDANSSIILNGSGNMGILVFTTNEEEVENCTVNIENNGWITLGSSMNINGTLSLNSGNVACGNNNLSVSASGTVEGGSENSYVLTNGEGQLVIFLEAGGESGSFHVGTSEGYFPCIISENEGAEDTEIGVRLLTGVFAQGETGADLTTTENLVNHTWLVSSIDGSAQVDLDFQFSWHSSAEVNGFDNSNCLISHYLNGAWDVTAAATANVEANGYFSISRENITALSPFRVADDSVSSLYEFRSSGFNFYPNPAKDFIILETKTGFNGEHAEIFDIQGKQMKSFDLKDKALHRLKIHDLPTGTYILKLDQKQGVYFIKE